MFTQFFRGMGYQVFKSSNGQYGVRIENGPVIGPFPTEADAEEATIDFISNARNRANKHLISDAVYSGIGYAVIIGLLVWFFVL